MFVQISQELVNSFFKLRPNCKVSDLEDFFYSNFKLGHLDYKFKSKKLLLRAFTHKSFAHESKIDLDNNERLEFLGDSVLSLVISEYIFEKYSDVKEGDLSKLRSSIVNEDALYKFALFTGFSKFILLGKGELAGKGHEKKSILSDCFEAYLGALYLDSDFTTVRDTLLNLIFEFEKENESVFLKNIKDATDSKTKLQELVYKQFKTYPKYDSIKLKDEDAYMVSLFINEEKIGSIKDKSKKNGMQLLATQILKKNIF